jgi:hypothetical protein
MEGLGPRRFFVGNHLCSFRQGFLVLWRPAGHDQARAARGHPWIHQLVLTLVAQRSETF